MHYIFPPRISKASIIVTNQEFFPTFANMTPKSHMKDDLFSESKLCPTTAPSSHTSVSEQGFLFPPPKRLRQQLSSIAQRSSFKPRWYFTSRIL